MIQLSRGLVARAGDRRRAVRRMATATCGVLIAFAGAGRAAPPAARGKPESAARPPGTYVTLSTALGDVVIRLLPADAPGGQVARLLNRDIRGWTV